MMKRKLFSAITSAIMSVTLLGGGVSEITNQTSLINEPITASAEGESISISSVEGKPGETVTVEIEVSCNDKFLGLSGTITWDAGISWTETSTISGGGAIGCNDSNYGSNSCDINLFNFVPLKDGVVATLDFYLPEVTSETTYDISFSSIDIFNVQLENGEEEISDTITSNNGGITVIPVEPEIPTLQKGINEIELKNVCWNYFLLPSNFSQTEYIYTVCDDTYWTIEFLDENNEVIYSYDNGTSTSKKRTIIWSNDEEDLGKEESFRIFITAFSKEQGDSVPMTIVYGNDVDFEEKTLEELESYTFDVQQFYCKQINVTLEKGVYNLELPEDEYSVFWGVDDGVDNNDSGVYKLEAGTYSFRMISRDYLSESVQGTISITPISSGDITGDSAINLYDAIEICRYIMEMRDFTEAEKETADYNGDGEVNLYDVIEIAKFMMS